MVQTDTITKMVLVKHAQGIYFKFNIANSRDLKKMTVGVVALDRVEMENLYGALKGYFEEGDMPKNVEVRDLTKMSRRQVDNNRYEKTALPDPSPEQMQKENDTP